MSRIPRPLPQPCLEVPHEDAHHPARRDRATRRGSRRSSTADGRSTDTVAIPSPVGFPVEGRPHSDLMRELRWYLETFLDYPFPPETEHAERVQDALAAWGKQAFDSLFGDRRGGALFGERHARGLRAAPRPDLERRPAGARLAVGGAPRPAGRPDRPALPDRAAAQHGGQARRGRDTVAGQPGEHPPGHRPAVRGRRPLPLDLAAPGRADREARPPRAGDGPPAADVRPASGASQGAAEPLPHRPLRRPRLLWREPHPSRRPP